MKNTQIILASTSPFRKQILEKLAIPFSTEKPHTDETALENETAEQLVFRLAEQKALAVANK
ncbi:MAG: septum formation inhibitor Maf, partial [Gammaproteobacteria bacterium]|nr:septum formation inhibitor Maf [Gammaproteobacteria bacterium]